MTAANYMLLLLCTCAPENGFGQDAIEHAIVKGNVTLTYTLDKDVATIMSRYDAIIESFRPEVNKPAIEVFNYESSDHDIARSGVATH